VSEQDTMGGEDEYLAKSTFPNGPEKVEMIESNLAFKIYRVRETASHIAFREEEGNGGIKVKRSRKYKSRHDVAFEL
jgi:hypothetical protein